MESIAQDENKGLLESEAIELLDALQRKHSAGSTTFYIRRDGYLDKRFLELDLEKLRFLEEEGMLKMSDYKRQGILDPNVIALNLLPKALAILKSRTTVTRTETTIQESFKEPAWKTNQRTRDFGRTERGCTIMLMNETPEALASDVRSHIQAIRSGILPRRDFKCHQIWLRHILARCWNNVPEELRHEAEDCRDLPYRTQKAAGRALH